jgi:hypothetical protein
MYSKGLTKIMVSMTEGVWQHPAAAAAAAAFTAQLVLVTSSRNFDSSTSGPC